MTPEHRKAKAKQYDKAYRLRHPEKVKARNAAWRLAHLQKYTPKVRPPQYEPTGIWYRYKLTTADYQSILQHQGLCCAICKMKKPLVVDHNHATGKVRGLLCGGCNKGIGFLLDSPVILQSAITYLQ